MFVQDRLQIGEGEEEGEHMDLRKASWKIHIYAIIAPVNYDI